MSDGNVQLQKNNDDTSGFLQRIINLIFSNNDPDKEKKRLLKDIRKELKKHSKYYKLRGDSIQPALAKIFHEIYQIVGPSQVFLENINKSGVIKKAFIISFMNDKQLEILNNLDEESLKKRSETVDVKELIPIVKNELVQLFSLFDMTLVKTVNSLYTNLLYFQDFINYDYYFLLRKFDSMMPEREFQYIPKFDEINGEYILEDLKDFNVLLPLIDETVEWESIFKILKSYRNIDVISLPGWKKVLQRKKELMKSGLLDLLIKLLDENPYYTVKISKTSEEIVEPFLNDVRVKAEKTLKGIKNEKKAKQIDSLLLAVFNRTDIFRTKFYTEKANLTFQKKVVTGFIYVEPINCLKAYYLDFFKTHTRKVIDLLLIQGKWSTNLLSQQFSESFHELMAISDELLAFDESLSDDGTFGSRIKKSIRSADRDSLAMNSLSTTLEDVNTYARGILNRSANGLITIGKNLKNALNDYKKNSGELLVNWKELEIHSEFNIEQELSKHYKQIYYLIQLLQSYVKNIDG
jgi:hypothetical protein